MLSQQLKILQVIHGYPMRYNAGSEVYTQGLAQAFRSGTRYTSSPGRRMPSCPSTPCRRTATRRHQESSWHVINMARARDGYRHQAVDDAFSHVLNEVRPDVVHIGHLTTSPRPSCLQHGSGASQLCSPFMTTG